MLAKLLQNNGISGLKVTDTETCEQQKKAQEIAQYEAQRRLIIDMKFSQYDQRIQCPNNMNMIVVTQNNSEIQSKTLSPITYNNDPDKQRNSPYNFIQSPQCSQKIQNIYSQFTLADSQEIASSISQTNLFHQTLQEINKRDDVQYANSQVFNPYQFQNSLQINQVQIPQPPPIQPYIYSPNLQLVHYENTRNDSLMFNQMKFNIKGQADNQLNLDECGLIRFTINRYDQQITQYTQQLTQLQKISKSDVQIPENLNTVIQNFLTHNYQTLAAHNSIFWKTNNHKLLTEVAKQLQAIQIQNMTIPSPPLFWPQTQQNPQQLGINLSKINSNYSVNDINNIKIPQVPIQPVIQRLTLERKLEQNTEQQYNETQQFSQQLHEFYNKRNKSTNQNKAQVHEILNQILTQISIQDIQTMVLLCMQSYLQSESKTIDNIFNNIDYIIKHNFSNKTFQLSQQIMIIISFIIDDMKNILDQKVFQHTFKQVDFQIFQRFYQSNEQYKFTYPEVKQLFEYANEKLISQLQSELCPKQMLHKI